MILSQVHYGQDTNMIDHSPAHHTVEPRLLDPFGHVIHTLGCCVREVVWITEVPY